MPDTAQPSSLSMKSASAPIPGAGILHVSDEVRPALASSGCFTGGAQEIAGKGAFLERQGSREAVAEGEGVGQQVHVRIVVEAERAPVLVRDVAIGEERRRATGGQAAELDVGLSEVRRVGGREGAGLARVHAGVTVHLHADEGAEQAVSGGGAGVELNAATSAEADRGIRAELRLEVLVLSADAASNAKAGFRARDVEEACAVGGADANVFNSSSLLHGKVGSLSSGNSRETRDRSEEEALNELHG
jgi:hypothetical protein